MGLPKEYNVLENKVSKLPQNGEINLFCATKEQDENLKISPGFGNIAVMTDTVKWGHEQAPPHMLIVSIK